MSKHIDEVIKRLGYYKSPCLLYKKDYISSRISLHVIKVLKELSPYAVYFIENKPFVLFFNESSSNDIQRILHKKIWNTQIPVIIFCNTAAIKIYTDIQSIKKHTCFQRLMRFC